MTNTVLITGCSSGFGKLAAKTFHQNGWNVIATMRTPAKETELTLLEDVLVCALDVTDEESISAAIDQGLTRFGRIDALVNNAGYGGQAVFEQATDESIREMFETNVFGPMNIMRTLLPVMRREGGGTVVNVTSMAALMPIPGSSVYTATKHAMDGLTEALALEYEALGVRVRLVEPGAFPTTQFNASVDTRFDGDDPQLEAHKSRMREHLETQVARVAAEGLTANNPQVVADKIFECVTADTPIHNPVGFDADMLVSMMDSASSRQSFLDQVSPLLVPPAQ